MAANWNPRRFVISAQICLDLLFRTKSVIPCNSCQVVKHKGGWFVDQRQNHLQIFLKIENISGLWFTNPSLWISNSKQRDETPIPGDRSVDLDWCWWNWCWWCGLYCGWRHQCFGVDGDTSALASHWCQIKGEQFPRQMSATLVASCYDKHNIITTWKFIKKIIIFIQSLCDIMTNPLQSDHYLSGSRQGDIEPELHLSSLSPAPIQPGSTGECGGGQKIIWCDIFFQLCWSLYSSPGRSCNPIPIRCEHGAGNAGPGGRKTWVRFSFIPHIHSAEILRYPFTLWSSHCLLKYKLYKIRREWTMVMGRLGVPKKKEN